MPVVRVLSSLNHDNRQYEIGSEADLPEGIAKALAKVGVVAFLSTIVEQQADEKIPDSAPQEDQAEAQEEAPQTPKKTSKRRTVKADE